MLARKKNYFNKAEHYDQFSLQAAGRVYRRLLDKRCFTTPPALPPVKSCLNYIKHILYPFKVDYEQAAYSQLNRAGKLQDNELTVDLDLLHTCACSNRDFAEVDFRLYLDSVHLIIR